VRKKNEKNCSIVLSCALDNRILLIFSFSRAPLQIRSPCELVFFLVEKSMPPGRFGSSKKKANRKKKKAARIDGQVAEAEAADGSGGGVVSEVGRCLLSSSMGCEAGVRATVKHFNAGNPIGMTVQFVCPGTSFVTFVFRVVARTD
jgi:hypothetical protein